MDTVSLQARIQAIENTTFTQIPGPNPILITGEKGSWDDRILEMCDILKENGKYYLYYHASGNGESYRIGVAVADHPLGPFVKYGDAPILDLKSFGSDDDRYIACGSILKEKEDRFLLFYSLQRKDDPYNYYIGLATASHPLGPWTKYEHNPIMQNFGYVGGVTKKDGKYYMFNEYPTHLKASDYGPICVAVADAPEGPWEPCREVPVLPVDDWGVWDDAGYSESNVKYDGQLFHLFYGGAKTRPVRIESQESVGYAYSADGRHFTKYGRNPVARREAIPFGAAMAEVCFLTEYPYIYVYHTLRYSKPWREEDRAAFPAVEHIGVQVLCVSDRFTVDYPVYTLAEVAPGTAAGDPDKLPLNVENADSFALTVRAAYEPAASEPLRVHVLAGTDPENFDTEPLDTFVLPLRPGQTVQKTFTGSCAARFLRIITENPDGHCPVHSVQIRITLRR